MGKKRGGLVSFIKVLETLQVIAVYSRWAFGKFLPSSRILGSQVGQRLMFLLAGGCILDSSFISSSSFYAEADCYSQKTDFNTDIPVVKA